MKKLKLLLLSCVFTFVLIGNVFASVTIGDLQEFKTKMDAWSEKLPNKITSTMNFETDEDQIAGEMSIEFAYGDISFGSEGITFYNRDELNSDDAGEITTEFGAFVYKGATFYPSEESVEFFEDEENEVKDGMAQIEKNIVKKLGDDAKWSPITSNLKKEVSDIAHGMKEENGGGINPTWNKGAEWMNDKGASIKNGINLAFSVFLWFLWVAFLGFELLNGAIILFPVVRDKVTGDGATIPWYITHNTAERLKNMEEEPMKKWLTGEIGRIITFFLISVGIFSGLIMWVVSFLLNFLPG